MATLMQSPSTGKYYYQHGDGRTEEVEVLRSPSTGQTFWKGADGEMHEYLPEAAPDVAPGAASPAGPATPSPTAAGSPQAAPEGPLAWSDVLSGAAGNAPASTMQLLEDTVSIITSPWETTKALGRVLAGTVQKIIPGEQDAEKYAEAFGGAMVERYGGIENFKRTIRDDPAGVASDLLGLISGGATTVARVGGTVGRVAKTTADVANILDPAALPARVAGRVLNPNTRPEVTRLMDQGVTPTPGQVLGGAWKAAEDKATSIPILGDVINAARRRGATQLNRAAYARALDPIGEKHSGVTGAEGIAEVSDKLGKAYDDLMPQLRLVPDDGMFLDITKAVEDAAAELTPQGRKILSDVLNKKVLGHMENVAEGIPGEHLKTIQTDLRTIASRYNKSLMASEQVIGGALSKVDHAIMDSLARSNPQHAEKLRAADTGYANYVRLRAAGKMANADKAPGFSPSQLRSAVASTDRSVGKGDTARGRSLMQDLSGDAIEVMGPGIPDSGTFARGAFATAAGGGLGYLEPTLLGAAATATTPYWPGAQRLAANLLARRPGPVRNIGKAVGKYGPRVAQPGFQAGRLERLLREQGLQ